jgi:hypothetical protein
MVYFRIDNKSRKKVNFKSNLFKLKDTSKNEVKLGRYEEWYIDGVRAAELANINVDSKGNVYERIF